MTSIWLRNLSVASSLCRYGTLGSGLVGMVLLGRWFNLMTLEVFSNLGFYDSGLQCMHMLPSQSTGTSILIFAKTRYEVVAWKKQVKELWNLKGCGFWVLEEGLQTSYEFFCNMSAASKSLFFPNGKIQMEKIVNFWMKRLFPNLHFKQYHHER